jgi:hypothetical protein
MQRRKFITLLGSGISALLAAVILVDSRSPALETIGGGLQPPCGSRRFLRVDKVGAMPP